MTQGPAISASGAPAPTGTPETSTRVGPPGAISGPRAPVLPGGGDEGAEQRMGLERLALEFRVELAGEEPGRIRELHDLDELPVRRGARDLQAAFHQPSQVLL